MPPDTCLLLRPAAGRHRSTTAANLAVSAAPPAAPELLKSAHRLWSTPSQPVCKIASALWRQQPQSPLHLPRAVAAPKPAFSRLQSLPHLQSLPPAVPITHLLLPRALADAAPVVAAFRSSARDSCCHASSSYAGGGSVKASEPVSPPDSARKAPSCEAPAG
jgi:hypothetical protein